MAAHVVESDSLASKDQTPIAKTSSFNNLNGVVEKGQQASPPSAIIDIRLEDKTQITPTLSCNNRKEDDSGGDRVDVGVDADPFYVGKLIGKGKYGRVYVHYDYENKQKLAVKKMDLGLKKYMEMETKQEKEAPYDEVRLMRNLKHDRIVQYVESKKLLCIYMELMEGGCVKHQLVKEGLGEATTKTYTRQLLEGLSYLHEQCDIMHLDVKSENLLCDAKKENIKITDFGVSKRKGDTKTNAGKKRGTPHYMAPELITSDDYCEKVDIWSSGATIVEMLTTNPPGHKHPPYTATFRTGLYKKAEYILDESISDYAKNFLNQAFRSDREHRPSARQLLKDPWLSN